VLGEGVDGDGRAGRHAGDWAHRDEVVATTVE
jgi:hypothetical protein